MLNDLIRTVIFMFINEDTLSTQLGDTLNLGTDVIAIFITIGFVVSFVKICVKLPKTFSKVLTNGKI